MRKLKRKKRIDLGKAWDDNEEDENEKEYDFNDDCDLLLINALVGKSSSSHVCR
jgi:hypothetical protein